MRSHFRRQDALAMFRMVLLLIAIAAVTWYWDDLRDWLTGQPRGDALLFVAAGSHDLGGIDRALAQGASINARNGFLLTPLFQACDEGDETMVRALLKRGADATVVAEAGLTPLHQAVVFGNPRIVEMLLAAGANPNSPAGSGLMLDLADDYDRPNIAKILRAYGGRHATELANAS